MKPIAPDVWHLPVAPRDAINVYVVGDVLVDAGLAIGSRRLLHRLARLPGPPLRAHALTHAHFDHMGASHAICTRLGLPLWCGAGDVAAVQTGRMATRGGRMVPAARAHPVARVLREGDELAAGFVVLETPGHSPGHLAFWRERDRVLVCGDVLWGFNPFTLRGPIQEPHPAASPDPDRNRASARRLAALEPAVVLFGHGPPLRDPARFAAAVARLAR